MSIVLPKHLGVLLFVNFHHVRESNSLQFPHLHHVSNQQFKAQIQSLMDYFNFPHPNEVHKIVDCGSREAHCILTFDDGLKDHYENVLPTLRQNNISGIFSVNTLPWESGDLTSVHQAHLLSAAYSYLEIAPDILKIANDKGVHLTFSDVDSDLAQKQYRYDSLEIAKIKYYLNATIPQSLRGEIVEVIFKKRLGEPRKYAQNHYLTPLMAREMFQNGAIFSAHTHRHLHLASATREERIDDLKKNQFYLENLVTENQKLEWISYPYGSTSSYDDSVIQDAQLLGFRLGLTMKRGINSLDRNVQKMRFARVDANDILGGKRPYSFQELFEI